MAFPHRIFLFWLLYSVVIVFGFACLAYLNLPQLALLHDRSHLTVLLLALYVLAEVLSGRQAWLLSTENRTADQVIRWLSQHKLSKATVGADYAVILHNNSDMLILPHSAIAEHFALLCIKANAGQRQIGQTMIVDITAERLYDRMMIADFIASRIVWVGILATIIGVIMAFWPMIDGVVSIDAMRANLGEFFAGIAVAFLPTAVSFVFKIVLDFNTRIISTGVRELVDKIACVSELQLLPFLEQDGDTLVAEA
jgi:hypothetical protein